MPGFGLKPDHHFSKLLAVFHFFSGLDRLIKWEDLIHYRDDLVFSDESHHIVEIPFRAHGGAEDRDLLPEQFLR